MFLSLLSTDGRPVDKRERVLYAGRMRVACSREVLAVEAGPFFGLIAPAIVPLRPLIARRHGLLAMGNVRLDNREEVRSWTPGPAMPASDLELVLEAYRERGPRCIPMLLGDFAFAIYHPRIRTLVAGRDAFGVKALFIGKRPKVFVLCSHLDPVHETEDLDEEFIADFLLAGDPGPERTVWADSRAVPPGSVVTIRDGKVATERFWTPYDFEPAARAEEQEQAAQFRTLFSDAVRVRLEPQGQTWAELSGGLDSSSVVGLAQTMAEQGVVPEGVAGTVTIVDELGSGDERRFSDAVVRRYRLRNEVVWNPWPWQDGGRQPRMLDEPRVHYPYFLRDELECDLVRREGARVLLSGNGSDHYLYGNRMFFSDWAAQGHPRRALRELIRWSIAEKKSVWKGLWRDLILPLAPAAVSRLTAAPYDRVPLWIDPQFARRTAIRDRLALTRTLQAKRGSRFAWEVANELQEFTRWIPRGPFEDRLEVRYPFLHRPLVELGLRLPADMRSQPLASKWLLRQALRDVLPDVVRTRSGKGGIDSRILWGMAKERVRLTQILNASQLAASGIIKPDQLRAAVERAWNGQAPNLVMLFAVLGLETWFYVRSGRWSVEEQSVA